MSGKNKPNEIYITRIYSASVKQVWDAWVEPAQVAQWWGPRGFTITTRSKDVRPGGTWDYTMHGPDGKDWPNFTTFHEVEKYSRLVYDHGATLSTPPMFRVTVLFTEVKGGTKMEMTMALATAEAAKATKGFIKQAGGDSTWDRLSEYLDHKLSGREKFVINRSFEVPLNTMYEMWTDPKHLASWSAPKGFDVEYFKCEIKTGGRSFYCMSNNGQNKMYGRAEYIELTKPHRIVYKQQFCDENEKITRHPMSPTWPETMLTTVEFFEEGAKQTRICLSWEPFGQCSAEEISTFAKARSGMTQGWTGSLDKLEEFILAK